MTAFVDTCVLIDVLDEDATFHLWSIQQLNEARENGPVLVSDAVFSEFSVTMESVDVVNDVLTTLSLERCSYSDADLFDAGKAFAQYKRNGGAKENVLPDFFIGAVAQNEAGPLITRDAQRFRTYFPNLSVIAP